MTQPASRSGPIVTLAGGVGASRFLSGLVRCLPAEQITVIVNTGDDRDFYGVRVCPDLDIVTYTLAGAVDPQRGFGLTDDRFTLIERLRELGHETWFGLGDRDFANSLHRTLRLAGGAGLAEVAEELRRAYGVATRILPMSEDPCPTWVELGGGRRVHFEEYLVRDGAPDDVRHVDLSAAESARPGPGVIESIEAARCVIVCPSNPVVSIRPILSVPGVREAIASSGAPVIAISPIVGGAPVKGPADKLLRGTGVEVSARGVAGLYRDWVDAMVIDQRDADQAAEIDKLGLRTAVVDTLMVDTGVATALAETALELAELTA